MLGLARLALHGLLAAYLSVFAGLATFQRSLLYHPGDRIVAPAQAGLPQAEELRLTAADGATLVAWHIAPREGRPLILYFHGQGGILADRAKRFRLFAENGWGLLAVSYRGYGGSQGAPSQDGILTDAEAAYAEARRRGYPPKRIVVMGESLGTGVATLLAANHEEAALVLDAPFLSALAVASERYWMFPVGFVMLDPFRSDRAIAKVHVPVLITHGDADEVVPIESGRRLFDLANEPKTFVVAPGGKHLVLAAPSVFPRAKEWIEAVTAGGAGR